MTEYVITESLYQKSFNVKNHNSYLKNDSMFNELTNHETINRVSGTKLNSACVYQLISIPLFEYEEF